MCIERPQALLCLTVCPAQLLQLPLCYPDATADAVLRCRCCPVSDGAAACGLQLLQVLRLMLIPAALPELGTNSISANRSQAAAAVPVSLVTAMPSSMFTQLHTFELGACSSVLSLASLLQRKQRR